MNDLRIAIVHPWVVHVRGGEKVFFDIARAFPSADLFTFFANLDRCPPDIRRRLRTTALQRLPFKEQSYRATLPLLPAAAESIDLSSYDLVVSSSSGWSHGVLAGDAAVHLCYMHTPPRYIWGEAAPGATARTIGGALQPLIQALRVWDAAAANRVTHLLANSRLTSDRIAATYGRASEVLHPPVEVDPFLALPRDPQGYALYVGELVQYKRVDLTIETAKRLHVPLLIAGDGPERSALEKQAAGADTHFFGRVSDEFRNALLTGASFFLYGGIEDFGIVFVEAMAAGIPIVGPKAGGLLDIGEMGGVAFAESQEIDDLVAAAERCLAAPAAYSDRSAAARFSTSTFRSKFISIAEDLVAV